MDFNDINEENIDDLINQVAHDEELQHALIQYHFQIKNDVPEGANMLFNYLFANPIERFSAVSKYLGSREDSQKAEIFDYFNGKSDDFSETAQGFLYYIGCGVETSIREAQNCYISACAIKSYEDPETDQESEIVAFPVALVMSGLLFEQSNTAIIGDTNNIRTAIAYYRLAEKNGFVLPDGYITNLQNPAVENSPFELINDNIINNAPVNDGPEAVSSSVVPPTPQLESPRKKARKLQQECKGSIDELCQVISRKNEELLGQARQIFTLTNENARLNQENANLQISLTEKDANINALQAEILRLNGIVETSKKEKAEDANFFKELAKRIEPFKRKEAPRGSSSDEELVNTITVPLLPSNPLKRKERPKSSSDEASLSDSDRKRQRQRQSHE